MSKLKILYIHGRNSSSKTEKAVFLGNIHDVVCIDMDTNDHEKCYHIQEKAIQENKFDLVIGSSFGGDLAVRLLNAGVWKGPTILLAQAHNLYEQNKGKVAENSAVVLIHSTNDAVVPVEGSRLLAKTGTAGLVELVEVNDDHRLHSIMASGVLVHSITRVMELQNKTK